MIFFNSLVGFETTSVVIQLTLLELAKNPNKQTKLRRELLNSESDPETLEGLPYLDAVTREGYVDPIHCSQDPGPNDFLHPAFAYTLPVGIPSV